jgi:MFS family permease
VLGRNTVYVVTYALFVILSVPTALVDNFAGLVVLRFITGFLGSPCLATGAASMSDFYAMSHVPFAIIAWTASAFAGPALGMSEIISLTISARKLLPLLTELDRTSHLWVCGPGRGLAMVIVAHSLAERPDTSGNDSFPSRVV